MTTETMFSSRDVLAAVRTAFRGSGPCHCHTVAKLGEDELVEHLIHRGVVNPVEVVGPGAITMDMVCESSDPDAAPFWALRRDGLRYLIEATDYTFEDLRRWPGLGPVKAAQIERRLAKFGMLLKGGDPAILERVKAEEKERGEVRANIEDALANGSVSPDDALEDAVDKLLEVAKEALKDGALLMNSAAKLLARQQGEGSRSKSYYVTILKRYAMTGTRSRCQEVAQHLAPVIAIAEAEKAAKKASRRPKATTKPAQMAEYGDEHPNVVRMPRAS